MKLQRLGDRLSDAVACLLAAVFLAAVIGKIGSPWGFQKTIVEAGFIPAYAQGFLFVAIPCIELAVAAVLVLGPRIPAFVVTLALLGCFTCFLVLQSLSGFVGCNCFGGETELSAMGGSNLVPLLRNGGLIGLAGLGLVLSVGRRRRGTTEGRKTEGDKAEGDRGMEGGAASLPTGFSRVGGGFTLVELLVVIGLIGVLLGLLLPVMGKARKAARASGCLSNLRQIGQLAHAWAATHHGYVPLAGDVRVDGPDGGPDDLPQALNDGRRQRYMYSGDPHLLLNGREWVVPFDVAMLAYSAGADPLPWQNASSWNDAVGTRNSAGRLFHCPAEPRVGAFVNSFPDKTACSGILYSGGSGAYMPWWSTHDYALNGGVLGLDANPSFASRRMGGRLGAVRSASDTVLMGDTNSRGRVWTPTVKGPRPATLADVLDRDAAQIEGASRPWLLYEAKINEDGGVHGSAISVLFVDGHAELVPVTREALRRCRLTN